MINNYFNPFSTHFKQSSHEFAQLSPVRKIIAVIAGIVGGILSPLILFSGSFALFQLSVKLLKKGDDPTADNISIIANSILSDEDSDSSSDWDTYTETYDDYEGTNDTIENLQSNGTTNGSVKQPDGSSYSGALHEGKYHGQGKLKQASGIIYEGTFAHGEIVEGTKQISFNSVYIGQFKDWKFHGNGTLVLKSGEVLEGEFHCNELVKGKITKTDGTILEGTFQNRQLIKRVSN